MTKVEAPTLEKAYELAAAKLSCSVTELQYEVIQYPSKGLLGLFSKQVVATRASRPADETSVPDVSQPIEEAVAKEIVTTLQEEEAATSTPATEEKAQTHSSDSVVEGFFESENRTEEPYIDRELSQSIEESLQRK